MRFSYDATIVGALPNGLTAAAVLAAAGLSVVVFESILRPIRVTMHPWLMARFGWLALRSAQSLTRPFTGAPARAPSATVHLGGAAYEEIVRSEADTAAGRIADRHSC